MVKIEVKTLSGKYSQKLLDHAKHSATDVFKTLQKEQLKNQKQLVIWLVIKLLIELRKFQTIYNKYLRDIYEGE